jgi:epoxyqueuosine reductase
VAASGNAEIRAAIRNRALAEGFDAVGFARPELAETARDDLREFLRRGYHGDMGWLAEKAERRTEPSSLMLGLRSIVVLGLSYAPEGDPLAATRRPDRGAVSVYAQGRDYHDVVKTRLKALTRWIAERWPNEGPEDSAGEMRVFVDTAPVMEKPLAQQAGLGWQGKHTNLVSRDFGSWLFLGEIYLALDLASGADEAETDHCGTCRACLDACPTAAFPAPYRLDARRCISYLTIEHKGTIDRALRPLMGNRIYGCDDCLAVCPWNKFARPTREAAFLPREEMTAPRLAELAALDDAAFRRMFAGSPVKRVGRDRFLRNALIAIGNSGERALLPVVQTRLDDPAPLVRAMAVWALRRLADPATVAAEHARRGVDADQGVEAEW